MATPKKTYAVAMHADDVERFQKIQKSGRPVEFLYAGAVRSGTIENVDEKRNLLTVLTMQGYRSFKVDDMADFRVN